MTQRTQTAMHALADLGQAVCEACGTNLPEPRTGFLKSWLPGVKQNQNFVK